MLGKAGPYTLCYGAYACGTIGLFALRLGSARGLPIALFATLLACATFSALAVAFVALAGNFRLALSGASFYVAPSFAFSGITFPPQNVWVHWWASYGTVKRTSSFSATERIRCSNSTTTSAFAAIVQSIDAGIDIRVREVRYVARSPWDVFITLVSPLLLIVLLYSIFATGAPRGLPVAVVDADHSAFSRALVRVLRADPIMLVRRVDSGATALRLVRRGEAEAIVAIAPESGRHIEANRQAHLTVYVNGLHSLSAGLLSSELQKFGAGTALEIEVIGRAKQRTSAAEGSAESQAIGLDIRSLYNPRADYESYLGGTLTPSVLLLALTLVTVGAFGRELRDRSVPDWLTTAGGVTWVAVLGKAGPYTLCYGAYACGTIGLFALRLGSARGLPIALFATLLACATFSALAVAFVALAGNFRLALSGASFYVAPSFAFSGITFPPQNVWVHWWALANPLTPYLELYVRALQQQQPPSAVLGDLGAIAVFLVLGMVAGLVAIGPLLRAPARWGGR